MVDAKRSFVTLDGLRGIAALTVITRHAPVFFDPSKLAEAADDRTTVGPFFESYLAVDFFFVLSGFVLAHAYGHRLAQGLSARQFMIVRLIRLFPLYLLALVISVAVALRELGHGEISFLPFVKDLFFAILFLPSPSLEEHGLLFPLNGPAWSLFFELLANFLLGASWRRLGGLNLTVVVFIAGAALIISVAAGLFGFRSPGLGAMNAGFEWRSFVAGCVRVAYSFFAGILVYKIWSVWRSAIKVPHVVVASLLVTILVCHPAEKYQSAFDLTATIIVFPALIWLGASSVANGPVVRVFIWLGAASYAVYVLQAPLYIATFRVLYKLLGRNITNLGPFMGAIFVVFVFMVALIADRYLDRPVRAMLTSRFVSQSHGRGGEIANIG